MGQLQHWWIREIFLGWVSHSGLKWLTVKDVTHAVQCCAMLCNCQFSGTIPRDKEKRLCMLCSAVHYQSLFPNKNRVRPLYDSELCWYDSFHLNVFMTHSDSFHAVFQTILLSIFLMIQTIFSQLLTTILLSLAGMMILLLGGITTSSSLISGSRSVKWTVRPDSLDGTDSKGAVIILWVFLAFLWVITGVKWKDDEIGITG